MKRIDRKKIELERFAVIGSDGIERVVTVTAMQTTATLLNGESTPPSIGYKTYRTDRGEHVNVESGGVMTVHPGITLTKV